MAYNKSVDHGLSLEAMYKLRIKFTKEGDTRFISHLDMVNLFGRAIRRANIPIEYSKGFNPRPKIDFSFALPLGMESLSEFADFTLTERIEQTFFVESLSNQLPEGIRILEAVYVSIDSPSLTLTLNLAKYEVRELSPEGIKGKIDEFMNNNDKSILHWRKKGRIKVDVGDIIKDIQCNLSDSGIIVSMTLKISSKKNIRPQEILTTIFNITEKDILNWRFIRTELSS